MRDGAILSGFLHGIIILLLFIGVPDFFRRELEPPPVIPIDIINIADLTQAPSLKVKPKTDAPKEEVKEKPVPPKPTPVVEKTPEPETKPEKETKAEPEPEKTMDDLLADIKEDKPKEEEKPKEKPKKEKPKEKKKDKPKPKKKNDFNAMLNNIEKIKTSSEGKTQPEQDESSTADHAANNISDVLSVTEQDLLRKQMRDNWSPPYAKDAKDISVVVRVEIKPDGSVSSVNFVSSSKPRSAPYVKQFIDSCIRAVKKASPLKIPLSKYNQMKSFEFNFDPKDMF